MSTNKRTTGATVGSDAGAAQDHLNVLYTAHQVHALAQIVFQQITGGWSSPAPWNAPAMGAFHACAGSGTGVGPLVPGTIGGGTGMSPVSPPALFYWYP